MRSRFFPPGEDQIADCQLEGKVLTQRTVSLSKTFILIVCAHTINVCESVCARVHNMGGSHECHMPEDNFMKLIIAFHLSMVSGD